MTKRNKTVAAVVFLLFSVGFLMAQMKVDIAKNTATGASSSQVQGTAADGAAPVGNPMLVAGYDGANVQSLEVTTTGALAVGSQYTGADGGGNSMSGPRGGIPFFAHAGHVFNGTTWDRLRAASAATMGGTTQPFSLAISPPGNWSVVSGPAAGSQGTASRAAGAAGVRHVCNCIGFAASATSAPAATQLDINLRDGATGAGTVIWQHRVVLTATTGNLIAPTNICGLNIVGTAATAMTVEWSAALANVFQSVSISGWSTQ